ncbi:MAG: hypothetical protein PHN56_06995 [Candidatus Nanoarchaeia archaeon]|nr:hypothetical protein [Candidatus Nanoarchaeia archaeon]
MKKYFEYEFNDNIRNNLLNFYEDASIDQHGVDNAAKSALKLERISELISFSKRDVVLDVGCSRGFLLDRISPLIKKGVGIDISKNIIELNLKSNKKDFKKNWFKSYESRIQKF